MSPIVYAFPIFLGSIAVEAVIARRRGMAVYDIPDTVTSLQTGVLSQVAGIFIKLLTFAIYVSVFKAAALFDWPTDILLLWAVALLLYDFCYYWSHRFNHEVNFLWAGHIVHHSAEYYNLSTALRQSSTSGLFGWVFYLPLAVLGVPPVMLATVGLIDLLYQYWVHTQLVGRIGWFEKILVSPSNHRVHHGQNDYCIDRNYGGIFIVWDRLFGTFADERADEPVVYGVRKPLESFNPVWANLHHWAWLWHASRAATGWRAKLDIWVAPPGGRGVPPAPFDAKAFQRFERTTPAALRWYVLAHYGILVVMLSHLLIRLDTLSLGQQLAYAGVIAAVAVVLGGLLEGRRWARAAELGRLLLLASAAVTPAWFGDAAPLWARGLVIVVALASAAWLLRAAPAMATAPAE